MNDFKNKKTLLISLLQFIGVYIVSLFFLAFLFEGIFIPDETVFVAAFFVAFAILAAYEAGKLKGIQK